jgi:hypothetical protein
MNAMTEKAVQTDYRKTKFLSAQRFYRLLNHIMPWLHFVRTGEKTRVEAIAELERESRRQFDPAVVDVFIKILKESFDPASRRTDPL